MEGHFYSKDFRYFYCEFCDRSICEQNPANGWHVQVRYLDAGTPICLKCYEEHILKNGIDRESFEDGTIAGMFLETSELETAGYKPVPEFIDKHIQRESDAESYCKKALELIDAGYTIVTDYERMAIGGIEGYVTMYARKYELECADCIIARDTDDCTAAECDRH